MTQVGNQLDTAFGEVKNSECLERNELKAYPPKTTHCTYVYTHIYTHI